MFRSPRPKFDGLYEALSTLSPREEEVLKDRFITGLTQVQVARDFNLSKERIRQIEIQALKKMRHPYRVSLFFLEAQETTPVPTYLIPTQIK